MAILERSVPLNEVTSSVAVSAPEQKIPITNDPDVIAPVVGIEIEVPTLSTSSVSSNKAVGLSIPLQIPPPAALIDPASLKTKATVPVVSIS